MSISSTHDVLPATTRVWIYQSTSPFREEDLPTVRTQVQQFTRQWISHNRQLRAFGDVLYNRFIVLMVDESQADASGCSIDKSVYFLKSLQQNYGVDLFDRMHFTYRDASGIHTVSRDEFASRFAKGQINEQTEVFDTLVNTKSDFDKAFIRPLGESWHKRMV